MCLVWCTSRISLICSSLLSTVSDQHSQPAQRFGFPRRIRWAALSALLLIGGFVQGQQIRKAPPVDLSKIQHVVFIIKENRSFDHYFGTFPGAQGATSGLISVGTRIPLWRAPDMVPHDLDHSFEGMVEDVDGGKMDRFDVESNGNLAGDFLAYTQMLQQDLPNYWTYAQNFALSDATFASGQGPSYPNHLYTIAAQGAGSFEIPTINGQAAERSWGCDAKPDTILPVMDALGNVTHVFPCLDPTTLADSMDAAGVSWRSYSPPQNQAGYVWSAFDYVDHIRNGNDWGLYVVPVSQFVQDAAAGKLPSVSWVTPPLSGSEHPLEGTCSGENWTVQQINAVMQGPDWDSTAIFLVWDEGGGFYDHVDPATLDQYGLGMRVPMIIISPYVQAGYISHVPNEFASVLKFIEEDFGLQPLTQRDQNANDYTDVFNFSQQPLAPLVLTQRACPVLSATNMNFGDVLVGGSRTVGVQLTNYSTTQELKIDSVVATGDYTAMGCDKQLKPGHSCTYKVTLTPTASGTRTGTLTVTDTDPSSPQVANLTGIGTYVKYPMAPVYFGFGGTPIGSSSKKKITITNTGSEAVTIKKFQTVADFTEVHNCKSSLPAGGSCDVTLSFNPTYSSKQFGTLAIWDSDPSSPQLMRLVGDGTAVSLSPKSLNFGNQSVGSSSQPQVVVLTNTSSAALNFASIVANGDYTETNTCSNQIPAQGNCSISVVFTPTQQGTRPGTVVSSDSDLGTSPQTIPLTGVGVESTTVKVSQAP